MKKISLLSLTALATAVVCSGSTGTVRAQSPHPSTPKAATPKPSPKAAASPSNATKKETASAKPATMDSTSEKLNVRIILSDGTRTAVRTRRELGFALASPQPVSFHIDETELKAALRRIAPTFHEDAASARPIDFHGSVSIFPGSDARALNVPTTAQEILDAVRKDPATTTFPVALDKHPPEFTAERLKGINGILAAFSTRTSANPKRNHNVALAAETINGTLLEPGKTFSVNRTVGKRTQANGFLTAPVFVDAEVVPGIGGGVSQITGTLFNAAARAGLKIDEVHPHSRPVAYLPLGYDATVAFGEEDLRFTNDTGAPIYISYPFDVKTRKLTAIIFGKRVPGRVIRLKATVANLGPGKIDAELYRIVKKSGKVVSKERLFLHHYRWDPTKKE